MPYSEEFTKGKTFVGVLLPNNLHRELTRLCKLSGRSKAKEMEIAVGQRVTQLRQQEKRGAINGIR